VTHTPPRRRVFSTRTVVTPCGWVRVLQSSRLPSLNPSYPYDEASEAAGLVLAVTCLRIRMSSQKKRQAGIGAELTHALPRHRLFSTRTVVAPCGRVPMASALSGPPSLTPHTEASEACQGLVLCI
jgi:hypothetical protein